MANQYPADPVVLESQFIRFERHFPLKPGSLDLFGYEREKSMQGTPVLSPDRTWMAVSEVMFMMDADQTYSRVLLFPVGKRPEINAVLPPDKLADMEAETAKRRKKDPDYQPQVTITDVNPRPFWERYQPGKQAAQSKLVVEAGFETYEPYRFDVVQVADWSIDGQKVLMVYRPGYHHLGIRRTIPAIHDVASGQTEKLSYLPNLIWDDVRRSMPELARRKGVIWDIRLLGWRAKTADELIAKLVVFEGQSEVPAGFWSYNTQSGQLLPLGKSLSPDQVARNGWAVTFLQPTTSGEVKSYGSKEIPPPENKPPDDPAEKKRGWKRRLQFWKE